ncbi:Protein kinase, putative [Hondaea fermentalgiana]|uniref:non-specific serine/threonine protein kinase n=1 Tax=Hondaea fermentalgiana TaxID=2315210 RepID=A0A2R5GI63_9STRA|nr:Protein kinase, putative [Hondaea fermentalgiana]|eukprot:GBG30009.1 Protein kinase, putative [Hondaea fermentalgiana]
MAAEDREAAPVLAALARGGAGTAAAAETLREIADAGELRDFEWDEDVTLRANLRAALKTWWQPSAATREGATAACAALDACVLSLLHGTPEFNEDARRDVFDWTIGNLALEALQVRSSAALHDAICVSYALDESAIGRTKLRGAMGGFLKLCAHDPPDSREGLAAVAGLLHTVTTIVQGMVSPLSKADLGLLTNIVLPLHGIPGKVSPSESALGEIHRPLTACVMAFARLASPEDKVNIIDLVIKGLTDSWPTSWEGNSPKEVLLLHGLETLLRADLAVAPSAPVSGPLVGRKLGEAVASDNSTVCERALMYWKHPETVESLYTMGAPAVRSVARSLFANALTHWNHTVARLAPLVLSSLYDFDRDLVTEIAIEMLGADADVEAYIEGFLEAASKTQEDDDKNAKGEDGDESEDEESSAQVEDEDIQSSGRRQRRKVRATEKASIPAKRDVSFMNMIVGRELGHGSFSKVFHAQQAIKNKPSREWPEFAIKRMSERHRDIALREAEMMDAIQHPLCTRLVGLYESAGNINLVMEYAASGDLHSALASIGTLDADTTRFVAGEVASALRAVHGAGLIFGDLKPENVLIHANGHVKLGDFGATRPLEQIASATMPLEGTLAYLAPELFRRRDGPSAAEPDTLTIPEAIDWWAYGCVVYQMLAGQPPLWVEDERDVVKSLVSFEIERYPDGFPEDAQALVDALLVHDPAERLCSSSGAQELESNAFFAPLDVPFDELYEQPAPKFAVGKVKQENGPWTQRSYSMMIAPLPEAYAEASGASSSIVNEIAETDKERQSVWGSAQGLQQLRRPQGLPPVGEGSRRKSATSATAATAAQFMSVMPGMMGRGRGARRGGRGGGRGGSSAGGSGGKFMVKGLDLTAG